MSGDFGSLGSGEVEYSRGRTMVHFGSPAGTRYSRARRERIIPGASRMSRGGGRRVRS